MNRTKITIAFASLIIFLSFIIGIYFYPQMPEEIASHWNAKGEVDDYMPKFWGLFLMPIVSTAILIMFIFIPKIDPLRANIEKFRKYFEGFITLIIIFLFYIYILTIFWHLDYRFNMTQMIIPMLSILFYWSGILIEKAEQNWFIGIKTPWTLSNKKVWKKTHQISGKLFKISGIISLIGLLLPMYGIYFVLVPVVSTVIFAFVYSFLEYKKINP